VTKREYFDLLVKTSREVGFPSTHYSNAQEGWVCDYRSPDGRKCAVGLIIPDEDYRPDFEGRGASFIVTDFLPGILPEGMRPDELYVVQGIHDMTARVCRVRAGGAAWDHELFVSRLASTPFFQEFASDQA
jgi:hypothetical protein